MGTIYIGKIFSNIGQVLQQKFKDSVLPFTWRVVFGKWSNCDTVTSLNLGIFERCLDECALETSVKVRGRCR